MSAPQAQYDVRPAAVAGLFYPDDPRILAHDIDRMLGALPEPAARAPKALIVPHAGYLYSGPIAASAYRLLTPARTSIRRVVLLGPAHRAYLAGLALPGCRQLATPLGRVPVDLDALPLLADLPQVSVSAQVHAQEHALEVQLPFLQRVLEDFGVVPFAVGEAGAGDVAEVLDRLWSAGDTLIVVSSDLSHYHPYAEAQRIDRATAQSIAALDPRLDHRQACGATAIAGLLRCARARQMDIHLLDLRNSGDTAGDRAHVVGYGAFALYEPARHVH